MSLERLSTASSLAGAAVQGSWRCHAARREEDEAFAVDLEVSGHDKTSDTPSSFRSEPSMR
jgi:hypothetical protein